jgi:hypothetical protein
VQTHDWLDAASGFNVHTGGWVSSKLTNGSKRVQMVERASMVWACHLVEMAWRGMEETQASSHYAGNRRRRPGIKIVRLVVD